MRASSEEVIAGIGAAEETPDSTAGRRTAAMRVGHLPGVHRIAAESRFRVAMPSMTLSVFRRPVSLPLWCFALWFAVLCLQWPLVWNPGYFSHDELQWAAFADVAAWEQLPWVDWFDWRTFQYRPLTFNLWLPLSHALFERPLAFHAVWVALGSGNALLLGLLLRGTGLPARVAFVAALVFALNPYAAYVHGWIATLADLLWVGIGLATAIWLQRRAATERDDSTRTAAFLVALLATTTALLAKEAAIVFPALALLATILSSRRRIWSAATAGSALAALVYLALRVGPLLQGARPDSGYGLSLLQIPQRWLEYHGFTWLPTLFEIQSVSAASTLRLAALMLVSLAFIFALWRARPHYGITWLVGSAAALGPVLILTHSANQYGYGFSVLGCGLAALAWPRTSWMGRMVLACAALLTLWHGINVQFDLQRAGRLQARFSPALAAAVQGLEGADTVVLDVAAPGDRWLYTRLTHAIAAYRGVVIGERVRLAANGEPGSHRIETDGSLTPLAPPDRAP